MTDFDRIVRERERAAAEAKAREIAAERAPAQAKREALWHEAARLVPSALEAIRRQDPAHWPPAKTVRIDRKTLFGGFKPTSIAGFVLVSFRYLGPEQTSVTPVHLQYESTIFLLSDGRLALDGPKGSMLVLNERPDFVVSTGSGFWGAIPMESVRDRLRALANS